MDFKIHAFNKWLPCCAFRVEIFDKWSGSWIVIWLGRAFWSKNRIKYSRICWFSFPNLYYYAFICAKVFWTSWNVYKKNATLRRLCTLFLVRTLRWKQSCLRNLGKKTVKHARIYIKYTKNQVTNAFVSFDFEHDLKIDRGSTKVPGFDTNYHTLASLQKYHLPRKKTSPSKLSLKYIGPKIRSDIAENLRSISPY